MATIKHPDEMTHAVSKEKSYRHRAIGDHVLHPETQMMGYGYDPELSEGSVKCPIFMTSTFAFKTAEDGKAGAVFSSGMGAIASMLLTFLWPGDAIVHSEPMYGGTETLLESFLPQFGIHRVGFMAGPGRPTLEEAVAEAKAKGPIRMIFIETPANPTNGLVDIRACADVPTAIE